MSDWVGRTLSKVEVQRLLGHGGMADVYLGRHTTLNRPVAVKILHAHLSEDDSLLGRFRSEAQAVATLRHPNIVQVFDFDVINDRPYIIMELLEGVSLKDYLSTQRSQNRRVPPQTVARLIEALASALDYAHARGIVHRDIKPANVMLRREGGQIDPYAPLPDDVDPILTDFGVARLADASVQTASGVIIGTPAYMSPEQVKGDPADARSDIYSLGIMLYEMLAGVLPFEGDTQASILIKHINQPPPPLPEADPAVQAVVDRALAKNPKERFQRASELAGALRTALEGREYVSVSTTLSSQRQDLSNTYSTQRLDIKPSTTTAVGEPQATKGSQQTAVARSQTSPLLWIVGATGVLALIIAFLVFARPGSPGTPPSPIVTDEPTVEPTTALLEAASPTAQSTAQGEPTAALSGPGFADVEGEVVFRNAQVTASLSQVVAPPDGSVYEAWLIEPDVAPLSLGTVNVNNGALVVHFTDSEGHPLLNRYSGFAISIEPASDSDPAMSGTIAYQGQVDPQILSALRLLYSVHEGEELQPALLGGIAGQAQQFDSHLGFIVDAIDSADLPGTKTHAEHVINIAVGRNSEDFLDWNGSGRAENPGDDVGLINYLMLLRATLPPGDASNAALTEIEALLNQVEDLVDLAKRISDVDTLEEVADFAEDMRGVQTQPAIVLLISQTQTMDLTIRGSIGPAQP